MNMTFSLYQQPGELCMHACRRKLHNKRSLLVVVVVVALLRLLPARASILSDLCRACRIFLQVIIARPPCSLYPPLFAFCVVVIFGIINCLSCFLYVYLCLRQVGVRLSGLYCHACGYMLYTAPFRVYKTSGRLLARPVPWLVDLLCSRPVLYDI